MTASQGFSAQRVVELCRSLERAGVEVWLDGGWGVDALLGRQTREHSDIDIIVDEKNLAVARELLGRAGFANAPRDDTRAWNFLLANEVGEQVDVHVINLDASGNGLYGPSANGQVYPAASLKGQGNVHGVPVRCLTADYQMESHRGYPLRPCDFADMTALALAFGLELPPDYLDVEPQGSRSPS